MPARLSLRPHAGFVLLLAAAVALAGPSGALACPFCGAVKSTLSQEIKASDVAVIARMTALPEAPDAKPGELNVAPPMAKFEIIDVLKGKDVLAKEKLKEFEAPFFADDPVVGAKYLFEGAMQPPQGLIWGVPYAVTQRSHQYLLDLLRFREDDPNRLVFLQDYLGDKEQLLSADSYDEFALAPYSALKAIKDKLPHDKLVERIKNPEETPSRRRLYLTMLGVCGNEKDLPTLETLLKSKDPKFKTGLDATIACYLVLKGGDGLPLVEKLFLDHESDEYTDIFSVVMALRTLGQEKGTLPQDKLVASMRKVLDHPKVADQAIMDLARWEDWTVMDRLVQMFKSDDPEVVSWVRVPVINYLRACPLPKAKQYIEELRKIDPKAVKQSETLYAIESGPAAGDATAATRADAEQAKKDEAAKAEAAKAAAREQGAKDSEAKQAAAKEAAAKAAAAKEAAKRSQSGASATPPRTDSSQLTPAESTLTRHWLLYGAAAIVCTMVISAVARAKKPA